MTREKPRNGTANGSPIDSSAGIARRDRKGGAARRTVLILLFCAIAVNYLDRSSLAVAAPNIQAEYGLSKTQLGLLFSVFSWTYVLMQLPAGWLLDRIGPTRAYGFALIAWSACTMAFASVRSFTAMIGLRLVLGVAEAPAFPANNKFVSNWFAASERGRATAVWVCGQYSGLALALPVLTWIIATAGWRTMFALSGAAGLVLAFFWFRSISDHPGGQAAEDTTEAATTGGGARTPLKDDAAYLLSKRPLWGMYIGNFCSNSALSFFLTWFPTYLVAEKGISFGRAGILGMAPYLAALCGALAGGAISDALLKAGLSRTAARKLPLLIGYMLSASIILANYSNDPLIVIAIMSVAFFGQGTSGISWAIFSDIAPLRMTGLAGGMFNFFTNLGGIITPIVIGAIVDRTGSFGPALGFIACLGAIGLLSYLFLVGQIRRLDPDAAMADSGMAESARAH
ncbi:MFS transporter [Sphingomonas sp.]|uniref:MFS transporter n=1 Tax=Sphingomonas sp. TaxID=28214 RepID=UPI0025DE03C7|nr:MFS transporter [Sphingomonas sp.]